MPGGRPPEPVPEDVALDYLEWLDGGGTTEDFCRQPGRPASRTLRLWCEKDKEFAAEVARARARGCEAMHERMLRDAREPLEGETVTEEFDGDELKTKRVRADNVARAKLIVETTAKYLATVNPDKYGEKRRVEHSGELTFEQLVVAANEDEEPPSTDDEGDDGLGSIEEMMG